MWATSLQNQAESNHAGWIWMPRQILVELPAPKNYCSAMRRLLPIPLFPGLVTAFTNLAGDGMVIYQFQT
jgi:hypothetical protein